MKLNDFSKGLNIRLDPTLIAANEATVYSNIDNTSGILKSAKSFTTTSISTSPWFYRFNTNWYSATLERDYVEYNSKLYFTEKSSNPKKVVGDTLKTLGITAPLVKLTTVQGSAGSISAGSSTLQYMYTYYDSVEGIESAPSPVSDELALAASKQVDISGFTGSSSSAVDKIRLYRVGADATDFTLIVELPITTTTYSDNTPTVSAIGTILATYDNQAPLSGLQFLTLAYGTLFAALDTKLYYTRLGLPDAWPSLSFINFDHDITGILLIQDGLLVFTNTTTYLLTGGTPTAFTKLTFPESYGCNSHKSCKIVKSIPVWSSNDGICAYKGGAFEVLSKDKLGRISFNIVNTTVFDETYFICLTDGNLIAMDLRFNSLCFKTFNIPENIDNIGVFNNILYAAINGKVSTLFTGADLELNYTSGEITEGDSSVTKMYNNVYVRANGDFAIQILIDNKIISSELMNGNTIFDIKPPQEQQRGSSIQFNINGVGKIHEIEYKVVGRQNGR